VSKVPKRFRWQTGVLLFALASILFVFAMVLVVATRTN